MNSNNLIAGSILLKLHDDNDNTSILKMFIFVANTKNDKGYQTFHSLILPKSGFVVC